MKRAIILCMAVFGLFMGAGLGLNSYAADQGYISVDATSQKEITPDVVDFTVEIVTTSKESMAKATEENKKISTKVYENLKKSIENSSTDSVTTLNYSASPVYRYNNNKRILDYYEVRNRIKVHTKNIANVGKMIDRATADGATSVNNISYSVSMSDDESNKLLSETAKKARSQGENLAKSIGSEIIGVKSISSSCSFSSRNVMPRLMMSKALGAADSAESSAEETSTNIEVGTMTLNARVHAEFYVK